MTAKNVEIEVKNIDHLGLVAGIIDEMGLVDIINELVGIERGEIVSAGVVVKGIILNGLGFVSRPLYLFPQFFEDKATEHLLGEGIKAEHLNDDKIGRVMDKLYIKGTRNIFMSIALAAVKKYGIETKNLHLDSTSFCLEGKYECQDNDWSINIAEKGSINGEQYQGKKPLKVGFGYSRDRRPDLKQFIVDLVVSGDGNIPLFLRSADGNESDKAVFGKIIASLKSEIDLDSIWVADSALYSKGNLQLIKDVKWITRVPLSIKEAQEWVTTVDYEELVKSKVNGYRFVEKISNYGGIEQRWLMVESEKRKQSDLKKISQKIQKEEVLVQQQIAEFSRRKFTSIAVAKEIFNSSNKKLKYHQLNLIDIQKMTDKKNQKTFYLLQVNYEPNHQNISLHQKRAGRFVLATNIVQPEELPADDVLVAYKEQSSVEKGFAFLKDPLFFADSVFLKTPERIESMAMLMGLCLLVYSLAQRLLHRQILQCNTGLKNQLGKLTNSPTLRWIFQGFQGVHLVILQGIKQIVNLTDERWWTLSFFPESVQKYYLLSG